MDNPFQRRPILYQESAGIKSAKGACANRGARHGVNYCLCWTTKRKSLSTAMSGLPRKNSAEKLMIPKMTIKRIRKKSSPPNLDFISITSLN
jgi:hypothetical protein